MPFNIIRITFIFFWILLLTSCTDVQVASLKVEYEEMPLGIDVEEPRFSWQMTSSKKGEYQSAYQITVVHEDGEEVWNSGKVNSSSSLNIEYEGKKLQPTTRYQWFLKVWNLNNKLITKTSWFETGLMNSAISAWDGAKWIGGNDNDLVLYPNYLPIFNINYTIQLDEESLSTRAGFIYGANDPRLMDKNKNIFNLQNNRDESFIEIELDISAINSGGNAFIHVYRAGYSPGDKKDVPIKSEQIPLSIINKDNQYKPHLIHLKTMYSSTDIHIGGEEEVYKVGSVQINPIGNNWDYICFPLLCEIGFRVKSQQKALFSAIEVRNYRTPNNILFSEQIDSTNLTSVFEGNDNLTIIGKNYVVSGSNPHTMITANIERKSMPMLRTTFTTKKTPIKKARLYITSRGIYEIYLNGDKIGNDYFNPGLTQYNKHQLYQTFDITNNIKRGDNAIGIIMGEGWWSGAITYMGYLWNLFGDRQSVLTKLIITYSDGTEEKIVSNPDSWCYFDNGPILYSSFFQGEVYDARKETLVDGWTKASYDTSSWSKATEVNSDSAIIDDISIISNNMPAVNDFSDIKLIGQYGSTIKKVQTLTAVSMTEVRPGVFVYDMGQNMVGVPRISLQGEQPGREIKLRFAEVKYPDLPEFKENVGMIMLENIRGAMAQDIYITKGGKENISPRFTFHGYRYIEITGLSHPLPLTAVKGDVLSSIDQLASQYSTSSPKVNKLWENISWSMKGNFLSIPTDCPQRNERMGWSGDISVFSRTATYMAHIPQFLRRHMLAMRDTQRADGRFADVAPIGGGFGGILWGSAGITVAWESYQQYNDVRMLEEHYQSMKSYINYLTTYIDSENGILKEGLLGDWLGPEQEKNDNSLLWESYFIYDLFLMHQIAAVLHKTEDAKQFAALHAQRKYFFNTTYFNPTTGQTIHSGFEAPEKRGEPIETHTSYILPLAFNICEENIKEKVIQQLRARIHNEVKHGEVSYPPYSLMTGFIGTAWINTVLSDLGYSEEAYHILQQTTYPSWLYSINQGATTIWERLNSYTMENGFSGNNSMNSFNHYSFGSIGAWMCSHSLGIQRDTAHPGFKHFILRPEPDPTKQITWARGHYDSMYGRVESEWSIQNGFSEYIFKIPANTTATLYLSAEGRDKVKINNRAIGYHKNTDINKVENGKIIIKLESGKYLFRVDN